MPRPLRITFVLPHAGLAGGIRVAAIYASALQQRGHSVTVVSTPRRDLPLKSKLVRVIKGGGWTPTPKPTPGHFDGVDVPHRVIDSFRPMTDADVPDADVIIATWWETAEWVAAMSARKGAKVYFVQHDETHANQPVRRVEATWQLPMYRIAVARWLVDLAKERYGVDQITLVANGVDVEQFNAPPRGKQKTPTVGLMYSTTPFKGVDISLEAVRIAARNIAGLRLVAFGQQPPTDTLPLPPETRYVCQPNQGDIAGLYASCDAWLFGSRSEGFGLPILEAMACRTPVIGTPAGALPELVAPGGGIRVKPQDPIDMARAIERLCRMTTDAWKEVSTLARTTAEANSWSHAINAFEAALLEAAPTEAAPTEAAPNKAAGV